jgi:hypothetical protein
MVDIDKNFEFGQLKKKQENTPPNFNPWYLKIIVYIKVKVILLSIQRTILTIKS